MSAASAGGAAFGSFGTKLTSVTAGPGRVARVTGADEGLQRVGGFEVGRDRLDRHLLGAHVSRHGHLGHPA